MIRFLIVVAQALLIVAACLVQFVLSMAWALIRGVLTFLVGVATLAAFVGLGGWLLTGHADLRAMFFKSAIAAFIVGSLLAGTFPALWLSLKSRAAPRIPVPPYDEPFDG